MIMVANRVLGTSEDSLSEDENEDLSRAIELSLLESNRKGTNLADVNSSYVDEDEQLVEALQDSNKYSRKSRTSRIWKRVINHQSNLVCDVCEEPIHSSWSSCPYWGQTFCLEHNFDGTPRCCSCLRFKLGNIRYINLSDGRKLCPDCYSMAIMDTEKCKPLFHEVYKFFEGLNMKVIKDVPFFLVDQHELNKVCYKQGDIKRPELNPLGATTYELEVVMSVASSSRRGRNIKVVKEVQYLSCRHEVTSMLVLYGFPKLAIGATLAHEMMHAWMRLQGYRGVSRKVEEGICEVMAHRWLDWHAFVGDDFLSSTAEQAQFLRNLKEDLKDRIERNYCEIYGDGFRDAKWAVERYGLKYTMNHIAVTGKFPQ